MYLLHLQYFQSIVNFHYKVEDPQWKLIFHILPHILHYPLDEMINDEPIIIFFVFQSHPYKRIFSFRKHTIFEDI